AQQVGRFPGQLAVGDSDSCDDFSHDPTPKREPECEPNAEGHLLRYAPSFIKNEASVLPIASMPDCCLGPVSDPSGWNASVCLGHGELVRQEDDQGNLSSRPAIRRDRLLRKADLFIAGYLLGLEPEEVDSPERVQIQELYTSPS